MDTPDFPPHFMRFLQSCVPAFPAAELLLFLASHPHKGWKPGEIAEELKPAAIAAPLIREYLALFKVQQLGDGDADQGFRFAPATPELRTNVEDLARAYNERPVTLIRTIYAVAENKIQSFADAFRLKND